MPLERIEALPDQLRRHWERFRACFTTRIRDTSEHAYHYLRGLLTMDKDRTYAGIARSMERNDGQAMHHFMSNSPWSRWSVLQRIQEDICATPQLAQGGFLILDESADEKADLHSAGSLRQYNGRFGKVDLCQVSVMLGYANWKSSPWTTWALVDSELFLPEEWFTPDFAALRQQMGISTERQFATKPELGVQMIRRAKQQGLPFEAVACDDLFRTHLRNVYRALDVETPESLEWHIVSHKVVWTFTRPVERIQRHDRLSVVTNCPGRLS